MLWLYRRLTNAPMYHSGLSAQEEVKRIKSGISLDFNLEKSHLRESVCSNATPVV